MMEMLLQQVHLLLMLLVFFNPKKLLINEFNGRWRAGFNIQNLGPKMSYDNTQFSSNFLPANMKLGGGFDFILDDYNKVAVNLEFSKLLVPTPQNPDLDGDGTVTPEKEIKTIKIIKHWMVSRCFSIIL